MTKAEALLQMRDILSTAIGAHRQIEIYGKRLREILDEFEKLEPGFATESAEEQVAARRELWEAYLARVNEQLGLGDIPE